MLPVPREGDLYEILGVPSDAGPPRIRRAYRELARAARLDGDRLHDLTHAYEVLADPTSRDLYDRLASAGASSAPEPADQDEAQIVSWLVGGAIPKRPTRPRSAIPRGDSLVRVLAGVGFLVASAFLVVVLMHG